MESMEVQLHSKEGKIEPILLVRGCLNVTIGEKSVAALCDTGASITAIKQSFLESLTNVIDPVFTPCNILLYLADNSKSIATKSVSITFNIGKTSFRQNFKILTNLSRPIILGCDFLQANEAKISFTKEPTFRHSIQPIVSMSSFQIDNVLSLPYRITYGI